LKAICASWSAGFPGAPQLGDAALGRLDAVARFQLAHVRQRRLGAAGVGLAAAIEVGLGQRVGLERLVGVLGVDQDDFQAGIGRLELNASGATKRTASSAACSSTETPMAITMERFS
jgi:hypothetical protein